MEKQCFKCHRTRPIERFYSHRRMADGYLNKCKDCTRADVARNRWKNRERYRAYDRARGYRTPPANAAAWRARVPGAQAAHAAVARALRTGQIVRGPCVRCGAPARANR